MPLSCNSHTDGSETDDVRISGHFLRLSSVHLKGVHVGNQYGRDWKPRGKTPLGFQDVRQGWLRWVSQTSVAKTLILRNGGLERDGGNYLQSV